MFTGITNITITTVGKFTFLWNVFERNIFNQSCGERAILERPEIIISEELLQKSEELKHLLLQNSTSVLDAVRKLKFRNKDLKRECLDWLSDSTVSSKAVIGAIFRIRCNTFHGIKTAFIIQGQLEMFDVINKILTSILQSNNFSLAD